MIETLKIFPILKGVRGKRGINISLFADILLKVSSLVINLPGIREMDLNPLICKGDEIFTVDARIRIGE
jgi:acetyltransferase